MPWYSFISNFFTNKKSKTVGKTTTQPKANLTPDQLEAEELALAQKLSNAIVLVALYFFKDKAKDFLEAAIQGISSADVTQTPVLLDIIDAFSEIDLEVANLEGNEVWIALANAETTSLEKIKAHDFGLMDAIHDLEDVFKAVKAAKAAAAEQPAAKA